MYIQWDNLLPVRKSLETFFANFINDNQSEEETPPICWAIVSPAIPNLESEGLSDKNLIKILQIVQDQKLEFFFAREYKLWYTILTIDKEDWIENNLYYPNFSDLWNDILLKIEGFCYADATSGFNIDYYDNFNDNSLTTSQDFISIMENSSAKLIED